MGDKNFINEIFSSPYARCVDTVVRFAGSMRQYINTDEIRVRDRLREQRNEGRLTKGEVVSVLDDTHSEVVLLCVHGDLASAIPE